MLVKAEMLNVAGDMFILSEKQLLESNQVIKSFGNYIGYDKSKNDVLNKVFEYKSEENIIFEKDEIFENNSMNRFIKLLNIKKCELQSNK